MPTFPTILTTDASHGARRAPQLNKAYGPGSSVLIPQQSTYVGNPTVPYSANQMQQIWCRWYLTSATNFVADIDSFPLGIDVFPAHR